MTLWERIARIMEDQFLVALSQVEGYADALCLDSHHIFVANRDPYEKGKADAYTDVLEYIAELRKCR